MQQSTKDLIDLKKLFVVIKNSIIAIFLFTNLTIFIAIFYIHTTPPVYVSESTIEFVDKNSKKLDNNNILSEAFGRIVENNLDTEVEVLKSRFILKKIIEKIDFTIRYYVKNRFKTVEFYKNSPFRVSIIYKNNINSVDLFLKPMSDKKFLLETIQKVEEGEDFVYSKIHSYGEQIALHNLSIIVDKIEELKAKEYYFSLSNDTEDIINLLKKRLSIVRLSKEASIIKIRYEDEVPLRAKDVVDAIAQTYISQNLDERKKEAKNSLNFIDAQLAVINKNLKQSEDELENYKKENTIVNIDTSTQLILTKLTEYESEISKVNLELDILKGIKRFLSNDNEISNISIETLQFSTPILNSLITSLQQKQLSLKSLLIEFTELHPEVIKLKEQIIILKNAIKKNIYGIELNLKNKRKNFEKTIEEYKISISKLPKKEIQLTNLKRSFMINEEVYSYLLQKRAEMSIIKASTISNIRVLDNAITAQKPIKPKKSLILIVATILGLAISIFLASIKEFFDSRVRSAKDIEEITDIPLLTSIPKNRKKRDQKSFEESLITLGAGLYFTLPKKRRNFIVITAPNKQEDISSVAINIAKILTTKNKKVILIDFDMREPKLHNEIKRNNSGISDVLSGSIKLSHVVEKIRYDYDNEDIRTIYTITSGRRIPKNPLELIMKEELDTILLSLSTFFDYIILNTTPLDRAKDAIVLMQKADLTLLLAKEKQTKQVQIKNFEKTVKEYGIKSSGIVLYA